MTKVFCIIPVRYDSTRVPGKPLRKILDKPLIEWTWRNALKVSSFSDVFIATDSEEIVDSAKKFGGKVIRTSSSHKSGTDRVAEAARKLNISRRDIIINIQSDEPLISPLSVEKLISSLYKSISIDMATLAYPSSKIEEFQNNNVVKVVVDSNDFALYFSRSPIPCSKEKVVSDFKSAIRNRPTPKAMADGCPQSAIQTGFMFLKHLGVYGYKMDFLQKITLLSSSSLEKKEKLEQLRVLENGYKIKVIESISDSESVNTEEDFQRIEKLLKGK